jgi:hypothetical protein
VHVLIFKQFTHSMLHPSDTPTTVMEPGTPTMNSSTNTVNSVSSTPSAEPPRSRFASQSPISLLVDSLKDRLLFAVPKKGESTSEFERSKNQGRRAKRAFFRGRKGRPTPPSEARDRFTSGARIIRAEREFCVERCEYQFVRAHYLGKG